MNNYHTALHQFSSFMMNHVIPFDTKLTSLMNKRDYKRYLLYFNALREYNQKFTKEKNFIEEFDLKLIQITIPIYQYYAMQLISKFTLNDKNKSLKKLDNLYEKYKRDNFLETRDLFLEYRLFVLELEKELAIDENEFPIYDSDIDIGASIYRFDHEKMNSVLVLMYEALNYLVIELKKHPHLHNQEDNQQELDYLIMIVNFELWNFISHISHAYTDFFKAPLSHISDIEKGTSHLKRAIMDIYDGLIIDIYREKITPKYLNIRNQKVRSLGHSKMILSLSENLRDYYLEISN